MRSRLFLDTGVAMPGGPALGSPVLGGPSFKKSTSSRVEDVTFGEVPPRLEMLLGVFGSDNASASSSSDPPIITSSRSRDSLFF